MIARPREEADRAFAWANGRGAIALILAVALVRAVWLTWICPYELAADEAQYWDWSRRLDLSYYSKGPGIAWAIAASTYLFGDAEWAVRMPAVVSSGLAMWFVSRLAVELARGDERAGFFAALAFLALPAYHATAIFMTIDAPYLACWACAMWTAARAIGVNGSGGGLRWWALLGLVVGVGFLFKYTILLLLPGIALWMVISRRDFERRSVSGFVIAAITFTAVAAPVVIWNARHDWPTLAHLLGHLGAPGGDTVHPTSGSGAGWSYDPRWTLEFLGTQAGMIGPVLALFIIAWVTARRDTEGPGRIAARFTLAMAAPILVFYLLVTLASDAEGNWPIAGYLSLIALVGVIAPRELERFRTLVAHWRLDPSRPRRGFFRRKPETPFQLAWDWSLAYGVIAGIGVMSLSVLDRLPVVGGVVPYHRISGFGAFAMRVNELRSAAPGGDGSLIIGDQYTRAALLAYYLPGHPSVCSATSLLGGRRSSYDFFADTRLVNPNLRGRNAILVGTTAERWSRALSFDRIELLAGQAESRWPVYLGVGFQGAATVNRAEDPSIGAPRASPHD